MASSTDALGDGEFRCHRRDDKKPPPVLCENIERQTTKVAEANTPVEDMQDGLQPAAIDDDFDDT